ncbi:hypothetical protein, partial [Jeotgalibaca arthritidis]
DVVSGAIKGLTDTGISIWQTAEGKRQADRNFDLQESNFDYQKALQQQIFDREDTAIRRRRADLESAGLNPNLAAGSAAGAGSVVSTTAPQKDSSWLDKLKFNIDFFTAIEDIKQKRLETEIMKQQQTVATNDAISSAYYRDMSKITSLSMQRQDVLNEILYRYQSGLISDTELSSYENFLKPYINANLNSDNQADMIRKQNQMWMFNNMADTIFKGINAGTGVFNSYNGYKKNEYQHQKGIYNSFYK